MQDLCKDFSNTYGDRTKAPGIWTADGGQLVIYAYRELRNSVGDLFASTFMLQGLDACRKELSPKIPVPTEHRGRSYDYRDETLYSIGALNPWHFRAELDIGSSWGSTFCPVSLHPVFDAGSRVLRTEACALFLLECGHLCSVVMSHTSPQNKVPAEHKLCSGNGPWTQSVLGLRA